MKYKLFIEDELVLDHIISSTGKFSYSKADINFLLIQVKKYLMELERR